MKDDHRKITADTASDDAEDEVLEEKYFDEDEPRRTPLSVAWRIIKLLATVFVFTVCILFIVRSCSFNSKSKLDELVPNDVLVKYGGAGGEYLDLDPVNSLSPEGYFYAYAAVYAPEAHQLQITVRCNISVYDYTMVENGHEYAYTIRVGDSETEGEIVGSMTSGRYVYRRLVFNGVGDVENTETSIVMKNGVTGQEYSSNVIHYVSQEFKNYSLSGKEKKSFEKYQSGE